MTNEQRRVILGARDMVKEGWCQDRMFEIRNGVVCRCLVSAIEDASTATGNKLHRVDALTAVLSHLGLKGYMSELADWNDHPHRTQAEVIALLESVAAQPES